MKNVLTSIADRYRNALNTAIKTLKEQQTKTIIDMPDNFDKHE